MPSHVFSSADKTYRNACTPTSDKEGLGTERQSMLVSGESGLEKWNLRNSSRSIWPQYPNLKGKDDRTGDQCHREDFAFKSDFGNQPSILRQSTFVSLEKIRLTYQSETERNYHVFYELLAGFQYRR